MRNAATDDAWTIAHHRYPRLALREDIEHYAAWLPARIERGTYIGSVADVAGRVIAGAGAVLLDWGPTRGEPSGTRARIVNVFTEAEWRRQGIARALVERVMAVCADLGVQTYSLAASADGERMYRSMGFVPYAEEMIRRRS